MVLVDFFKFLFWFSCSFATGSLFWWGGGHAPWINPYKNEARMGKTPSFQTANEVVLLSFVGAPMNQGEYKTVSSWLGRIPYPNCLLYPFGDKQIWKRSKRTSLQIHSHQGANLPSAGPRPAWLLPTESSPVDVRHSPTTPLQYEAQREMPNWSHPANQRWEWFLCWSLLKPHWVKQNQRIPKENLPNPLANSALPPPTTHRAWFGAVLNSAAKSAPRWTSLGSERHAVCGEAPTRPLAVESRGLFWIEDFTFV